MTRYTRANLLDIYKLRSIDMEPSTRKDILVDGFTKYNKLVRALLDTIFSHRCGDLYASDGTADDRIQSIKEKIAYMFSEPALNRLDDKLWFLEKQVSEYT
jgi:hypothetical protein